MASSKSTQALSIQQSAVSRKKALSNQQSALSRGTNPKTNPKKSKTPARRSRRRNVLRFAEAAGKTVEFIEMDWTADFPCVEVGFDDRTALLFELGSRLTLEPMYSNWKTGNQRVLRRWPMRETDE